MIKADETYEGEEQLLINLCKWLNKGLVYYHEEKNEIVYLTRCQVYFSPQKFWRLFSDRTNKSRAIKTMTECKEILGQQGYVYLGEL